MRTVADLVDLLENDNTVFMITINEETIADGKIVCDNVTELDWEIDNEGLAIRCEDIPLLNVSELRQGIHKVLDADDSYKIVTRIYVDLGVLKIKPNRKGQI